MDLLDPSSFPPAGEEVRAAEAELAHAVETWNAAAKARATREDCPAPSE